MMENHHKRAAVGFDLHPRVERQQHHQRTDIEQQDTINHLVDRFWNALFRVLRFSGGDADKLQPAEGEHDHRQRQDKTVPAGGEEAAVFPQVVEPGFAAAVAAKQHPQAKGNHADNRQHFYQRKPELRFAIQAYVDEIDGVNNEEEGRRPDPGRDVGQPVLHVDPGGGQLRHSHQHEHHPVVPAGQEAGERAPVFVGKVGKGAGYRLFHHHFAQLAHDQKSDNPGNGVTQ